MFLDNMTLKIFEGSLHLAAVMTGMCPFWWS